MRKVIRTINDKESDKMIRKVLRQKKNGLDAPECVYPGHRRRVDDFTTGGIDAAYVGQRHEQQQQ